MIELHNLYGMVDVNASANIACALRWGVTSVGSFSIGHDSPYMGYNISSTEQTPVDDSH